MNSLVNPRLEKVYVTCWSASGDADDRPTEEVALYYSRIAFNHLRNPGDEVSWTNTGRKSASGIGK
jgi:type VI protein secretion system component Hcp